MPQLLSQRSLTKSYRDITSERGHSTLYSWTYYNYLF
ncbi:MAG: hypothetical protein K0S56_1349 [Microvirga sp.]|nr:hypothetical protein [Microvirga sp.]